MLRLDAAEVLEDGYKLSPLDAYTCPDEGSLEEAWSPVGWLALAKQKWDVRWWEMISSRG